MSKKRKYIRAYFDRHGVYRIEFRRKGQKGWPLRQPISSPEFEVDYRAALAGDVPPGVPLKGQDRPAPLPRAEVKSFRWLAEEYKSSAEFKQLDPSTRKTRGRIIERLCREYGDLPYAMLNRQAVTKIRDKKTDTPSAANGDVKVIRYIYKAALARDLPGIDRDPTRDVAFLKSNNPKGHHSWTIEEVEKFEATYPIGTQPRLWLSLSLYAGCPRISDVVLLGRQYVTKGGRLQYTQFKNRNRAPVDMDIRFLDELRAIIDVSPTGDMIFLETEFGKPFSVNGFGNKVRDWCDAAGLPHCSSHGTRKAAAARLAELGCSDHEIMAMGGWKTLKEVQRYTAAARKRLMADNASDRLEADIARTKVSNRE
jgi:integrase